MVSVPRFLSSMHLRLQEGANTFSPPTHQEVCHEKRIQHIEEEGEVAR